MSRRSKRSRAPSRKKVVLVYGSVQIRVPVYSVSGEPPVMMVTPPTVTEEPSA